MGSRSSAHNFLRNCKLLTTNARAQPAVASVTTSRSSTIAMSSVFGVRSQIYLPWQSMRSEATCAKLPKFASAIFQSLHWNYHCFVETGASLTVNFV